MAVKVWLVLLLLPTVHAAQMEWIAPGEVSLGSPIHAAYVMFEDGTSNLQGHVNVDFEAFLNDAPFLSTRSIHEHDGFHAMMLTASEPGVLRLVGKPAGGDMVEHFIQVNGNVSTGNRQAALERATLEESQTGLSRHLTASVPIQFDGGNAYYDQSVLWVMRDANGIGVQATSHIHGGSRLTFGPGFQGHVDAWFMPPENFHYATGRGLQMRTLAVDGGALPENPLAAVSNPSGQQDTCDGKLLLDPAPELPELPSYTEHTDLRVARPLVKPELQGGNAYGGQYALQAYVPNPLQPGSDSWTTIWDVIGHDPWHQVTFRAPGPGEYRLEYTPWNLGRGAACYMPFSITALDLPLGFLDANIEKVPGGANVNLTSLSASGDILTHYEFDTLVTKSDGDGRLVWKSKLHGHAGLAAFQLRNLEAGLYQIDVFPSAQAQDQPSLASVDGFRYTFTVAEQTHAAPAEATPALPVALVTAALLLAAKRR